MKEFKKVVKSLFYCYEPEIDRTTRICLNNDTSFDPVTFYNWRFDDWDSNEYQPSTEQEFKSAWQQAQSEITLEYHRIFSKQNDFIEAQAERSNEL